MNKISEKDIAKNNNVSHNTVNRIIHSISNKKVLPGVLPTIMNVDEFKATNDTIGKMAFHIVNNRTGKTFDIIESRKSNFLFKYFMMFPRKQRLAVKFIILDMFEPYYLLLKKIFPNAILITDKFHVVALASNAFKNTRVKCMKKDKKNYNKLKHYWKLIQKFEDDLDKDNKKYSNHFGKEITDYDIVSYIINTNKELKATYEVYQGILRSIKYKDANLFCNIVSSNHENISEYMKTTFKSLNPFKLSGNKIFIFIFVLSILTMGLLKVLIILSNVLSALLLVTNHSIILKLEFYLFLVFINTKKEQISFLSLYCLLSLVFGSTNTI